MRWKLREIFLKSQLLKTLLFIEDFVSTVACLFVVGFFCLFYFNLGFVCIMERYKIPSRFPFFACLHYLNAVGFFLYL